VIHAFTSSAPNYFGKARVLFQTLRRHAPQLALHWMLIDRRRDDLQCLASREVDHVSFIDDFPRLFPPAWVFGHDLVELATAVKPEIALALLGREDCEMVVYFDPDIALFSPLDDLVASSTSASVLLTPHLLRPEKDAKAILDHEVCTLRNGIYNLGFVAVRNCEEGRAFLAWWRERCRLLCTTETASGTFTDQKWVDLAPLFFPGLRIVRDPRFNVAPWNLNQRRLEGTFDEGFTVEGRPLGFYHFTGFDSGAHQQVVDWYGRGNAAAHMLVQWYGQRSRFLTPDVDLAWRLGCYADGREILPEHRRIYRQRADLREAFPDPFAEATPGTFAGWLQADGAYGSPRLVHAPAGDAEP
jgi:hypothetical protein